MAYRKNATVGTLASFVAKFFNRQNKHWKWGVFLPGTRVFSSYGNKLEPAAVTGDESDRMRAGPSRTKQSRALAGFISVTTADIPIFQALDYRGLREEAMSAALSFANHR